MASVVPEDARALITRIRQLPVKKGGVTQHTNAMSELEEMVRNKEVEKQRIIQRLNEEKESAAKKHSEEKERAAKQTDQQVNLALELAFSADVRVVVQGYEDEIIPALKGILKKAAPELAEQLDWGVGKKITLKDTTVAAAKVFMRLIHMPRSSLTANTLAVPADTLETTLFDALKLADAWLEIDTPVAGCLAKALIELRTKPFVSPVDSATVCTSAPQWLRIITYAEDAIKRATLPELTQEKKQELDKLPAADREEEDKKRKLYNRRAKLWKALYDAGIQFFSDCAAHNVRIPYAVMSDLPIVKVVQNIGADRKWELLAGTSSDARRTKGRVACYFLCSIGKLAEDAHPCDALQALNEAHEGPQLSVSVADVLRNAIITFLAFDFDSLASSDKIIQLNATTFCSLLMSDELKAVSENVVVDAFARWAKANQDPRLICEVAPAVRFPLAKIHPLSAQLKELMQAHPVVKELVDEATKQQLVKAGALGSLPWASTPVPTSKRKLLHDDTPGGTVVPRAKARKLTPNADVQPLTLEQITQSML